MIRRRQFIQWACQACRRKYTVDEMIIIMSGGKVYPKRKEYYRQYDIARGRCSA